MVRGKERQLMTVACRNKYIILIRISFILDQVLSISYQLRYATKMQMVT